MGFFKSSARKVSYQSRFNSQAKLDHQLVNINDDCLEIKGYLGEANLLMGWAGVWLFNALFLPLMIYININIFSDWLNMTKSEWSEVNSDNIIIALVAIMIGNLAMVAFTLGWSWFNLKSLKKSSLIRFNRQTQTVYAQIQGHYCEAKWQSVKAEFAVQRMVYGALVETRDVVRIIMNEKDNHGQAHAAVIEATYSLDTSDDGCEMVWEFIRRFMFDGPDNLPITPNNRLDDLGRFQQISYTPKQAITRRWFWPIHSTNDASDVKWMHIIFWPFKVIFFIPNLLADIFWYWMVKKMGGAFAVLPEHSLDKCGNKWLTPDSASSVIKQNEKYITFEEAKLRNALVSLPAQ